MITIELKLLKSRKMLIPSLSLLLAMLFIAFIDFWVGTGQHKLAGSELSAFVSIRALQSSLLNLFFIFWMLQSTIHLINSGFYKMLLTFGWLRDKLFLFSIFQLCFYSALFMLLNFFCYSIFSFFYRSNPVDLILNTNLNALIAQYLCLFAIGSIGTAIAFLRPIYVMILPVFVYWLFESWMDSYIQRKFESSIGNYFPLQSIKQLIGENLMESGQIVAIAVYAMTLLVILHFTIQKKMFV